MPKIKAIKYASVDGVTPPRKGSPGAAGWDLALPHDIMLRPGESRFLDLGISFDIPESHLAIVAPRSNNCDQKDSQGKPTFKHVINLTNTIGVVDYDYTGSLKVKLVNRGRETWLGFKGDYILQIIFQEFLEVEEMVRVPTITKETERGDKGFGSTDE